MPGVRDPEAEARAKALYRAGWSLAEVGRELSYSRSGVRGMLERQGVSIRPKGGREGLQRVDSESVAQCVALYEEGLTMEQVAERLGMTYGAVQRRLTKHAGVKPRPSTKGMQFLSDEEVERTIALYKSGMSLAAVAREVGRSVSGVAMRLDRAGVQRRGKETVVKRTSAERAASAKKGWESRRARAAGSLTS